MPVSHHRGEGLEAQPLLGGDARQHGTPQPGPSTTRKRRIGVFSVMFIIFNRIIGTGIFATPATILALSGSIGSSFLLWTLGATVAAAGMQVYIVWGTALPRNGGEKNYLEYLFPHPRLLISCVFAANVVFSAWAAGTSVVFGEYALRALSYKDPSPMALKLTSFVCITVSLFLHGVAPKWGLRLQNVLGVFKILVLLIVVGTGFVALREGILQSEGSPEGRWRGRQNFENVWEGTVVNASSICLSLYSVIWSFIGFSNANYAMSEIHNPARTIRIAGPLAVIVVATLYILANVAYFSGASKEEIIESRRLVVALLMRNIWGDRVERWVDSGVACSALGNVLATLFGQGRVGQELGKEGALPFSKLWASNWPYNAPLAGLSLHWLLCILVIFFVPPGDAYDFVVNVSSYPLAVINAVISFGLIHLFFSALDSSSKHREHYWHLLSPITLFSAAFFGVANVFLFIIPLMKPPLGLEPYEYLPYWTHAVAGWGVFGIGVVGWAINRWNGRGQRQDRG